MMKFQVELKLEVILAIFGKIRIIKFMVLAKHI